MNKSELLAVAKPILFNTLMVQGILDNRKTATRRIVKEMALSKLREFDAFRAIQRHRLTPKDKADFLKGNAPYKICDILYVRETWCWCPCWDCGSKYGGRGISRIIRRDE